MKAWPCPKGHLNDPEVLKNQFSRVRCCDCGAMRRSLVYGFTAGALAVLGIVIAVVVLLAMKPKNDVIRAMQMKLTGLAVVKQEALDAAQANRDALNQFKSQVLNDAEVKRLLDLYGLADRADELFAQAIQAVELPQHGVIFVMTEGLNNLAASDQQAWNEAQTNADAKTRLMVRISEIAKVKQLLALCSPPESKEDLFKKAFEAVAPPIPPKPEPGPPTSPVPPPVADQDVTNKYVDICIDHALIYAGKTPPDYENALKELAKAAKADEKKQNFEIYFNQGVIHMVMTPPHYVQSEEDLKTALSVGAATSIQAAKAHFNIAVLYARTNRFLEVPESLGKAVALGYTDKANIQEELGKFPQIAADLQYRAILERLQ